MNSKTIETPAWPENPPSNWLTYHLAHPGPGAAWPADPNCMFYYKDRCHLHYIYKNETGYCFAHVSSKDMVKWEWHPTVLTPSVTGHGMYSGTGFFTEDGTPAMIYHGEGSDRNYIMYALDDNLDQWTLPEEVEPKDHNGQKVALEKFWDPDCWKMGNTYYAITGGKNPQLMKSENLKDWLFLDDFLHVEYPSDIGVPKDEDISCANLFKIGEKWMLLCISHDLGCRYYLGDFKDEKYLPEYHALMNWKGGSCSFFAPETVLTPDGRRVMWTWITSDFLQSGVQSLPRELELPSDGILRIRPLKELETLRYDEKIIPTITVRKNDICKISGINGSSFELDVIFSAPFPEEFGLTLLGDEDCNDGVSITLKIRQKTLCVGNINLPIEINDGENLRLRIFTDKNLVEIFANDRQAVVYTAESSQDNPNIRLFTNDVDVVMKEMKIWKMQSIYYRK